jgi:hypothetical protein
MGRKTGMYTSHLDKISIFPRKKSISVTGKYNGLKTIDKLVINILYILYMFFYIQNVNCNS